MKLNDNWKINDNQYKCPYCGKILTKAGVCSHIICVHTKEGRDRVLRNAKNSSIKQKGRSSWCKGLTKETSESLRKMSQTLKKKHYTPWNKGKTNIFSKQVRNSISYKMKQIAKIRASNLGVGRAYKGWYKNYWCDSQWELAFVIYCIDHNIKIDRCQESFEYNYDNETHLYYPDFIVDGKYIEIKGYQSKKDLAKLRCFPKDKSLLIYKYMQLKPIFNYILKQYNLKSINDIHTLYDKQFKKKIDKTDKNKKQKVLSDDILQKINHIMSYNINFSKFGWVERVAKLENISHTSVRRFMKKYMKEFYAKCYIRKH